MRIFQISSVIRLIMIFVLVMATQKSIDAQILTDTPEVSQIFRPIAEITDHESFEVLIEDFFLAIDPSEVEKIEIIDVTNNGFGPDDIMVIYPSMEVYVLEEPGPAVAEIMLSWNFEEQQRDASNDLTADYFYPAEADTLDPTEISEEQMVELVQNSIISDLILSLERNYETMPISLRFERDDRGFTFQMWNYDRQAFSFSPRPVTPEEATGLDMMFVLYQDSTIIADTTYYDLIYINKTVEETIYLPEESREVTNRFDTVSLPDTGASLSNTGERARIE